MDCKKTVTLALGLTLFLPSRAFAHCPLCTGGAGAAAVAAAYFGVKYGALGVFLGGFAVSLSFWIAKKVPQKFKYQNALLFWALYLSTVIPFYFMFRGDYTSKFVSIVGDYGSLLNRTYLIDMFLVGLAAGSLIVYMAPKISTYITKVRSGKSIKFQGLAVNFVLLLAAALALQFWPR